LRVFHAALQSNNVPGLVQRLLLLEALQQPGARSLLAPALRADWQQQQHLDLARAACGSSSSSNSDGSVADGVTHPSPSAEAIHRAQFTGSSSSTGAIASSSSRPKLSEMFLPVLAGALLRPLQLRGDMQAAAAQVLIAMHAADAAVTAGTSSSGVMVSGVLNDGTELCRTASYVLACLSNPACRCSLACWVLMWHVCMQEAGADYSSVQSR
jgi:hypothetical protein